MAKMVKMMSHQVSVTKSTNIIMPDSAFGYIYQLVNLIAAAYVIVSVPYTFAFAFNFAHLDRAHLPLALPASSIRSLAIIDLLINVYSMIEIYLCLTRLAREEGQTLLTQRVKFASAYAQGQLIWDCVASLPVALTALVAAVPSAAYPYLRILLLFRLIKVPAAIQSSVNAVETHVLHGEQMNANLVRVVQFVICIWAFVHCVAGTFVWLGHYELWRYIDESADLDDTSRLDEVSWITANAIGHMQLVPSEIYLRGYFWGAYTVITVGYGSIQLATNKERLLAVCAMSIGAIACNAGIAAVLGSIIGTADRLSGTCRRQLESVLRFCSSNKIDSITQQQLQQHHAYRSLHLDNIIDEDDELCVLGSAIRHEYIYTCVHSALDRVVFLSPDTFPPLEKSTPGAVSGAMTGTGSEGQDVECFYSTGFVHSLVRRFTPFVAIPDQVIIPKSCLPVAGSSARDCARYALCPDKLFPKSAEALYVNASRLTLHEPKHCVSPFRGRDHTPS